MKVHQFSRTWVTPAPPERVRQVLDDLEHYPEWWPQVLAVAWVDDVTARVLCRSALPYTLDLVVHAKRRDSDVLEVRLTGDLLGWSRFTLTDRSGGTEVSYAQQVSVAHRGPALAARLLTPVVRWNHDHMMAGCERGLAERVR